MRAAERIAAFLAIRHGIDTAVHREKEELLALAGDLGVKTFTTAFGQITVAQSEGGWQVRLLEDEFLAWAVIHAPDEVEVFQPAPVTRVRPAFAAKVKRDLVALGSGDVLMKDTGEIVGFASAVYEEPGDPYIAYPASRLQKAAKAAAAEWVAETAQSLTDGLRARPAVEGAE